jgi:hypothetical protein
MTLNPNTKIRNPKQIQMFEIIMFKMFLSFIHLNFENCFEFRASSFEFI